MTHAELLDALARTPARVAELAAKVGEANVRTRPPGGGFALVEQMWHLADLEREGYAVRVRLLLTEAAPMLPDFRGDAVARERRYLELDPAEGLRAFAEARAANVAALRALAPADLARAGEQEGVGRVTLADVPRMMLEHDRGHIAEIEALPVS